MQNGEFILDRWLPDIVQALADERGIITRRFSDDWVLQLQKGSAVRRIIGYKFDLNTAAAAAIAQDKVATYQLLASADIPAVEHELVRTKAADVSQWHHRWPQFVTKPLTGTSGHGVRLFDDYQAARAWMSATGIEAWAVSPFIAITREVRLVLLDGQVLLCYDKIPVTHAGLPMFNLGKGATPQVVTPSRAMIDLAQSARRALGLRLCAVDVVLVADGMQVLEVNEGLMMEHFMRYSRQNKQIGQAVYATIIDAMMQ